MKSRTLTCITAMTLFAALAIPVQLAAQGDTAQEHHAKHHHYKVIDIGTFGGPESFFNNLNLTDRFFFSTAFYQFAQVRNQRGTFVGFADTATRDPFSPFCYIPDCFVAHAFEWEKGIKTDLGTLPGGANSAAFWINAHGLIVGNSQNGELDPVIPGLPQIRAVLWKDGNITDLGTLGGSQSYAEADKQPGPGNGTFSKHHPRSLFLPLPLPLFFAERNPSPWIPLGRGGRNARLGHLQIAAFGILANGDTHAVLLIPCDENHNGNRECEDDGQATAVVQGDTNPRPNAILPENLRMLLRQRLNPLYRFPGLGVPRDQLLRIPE